MQLGRVFKVGLTLLALGLVVNVSLTWLLASRGRLYDFDLDLDGAAAVGEGWCAPVPKDWPPPTRWKEFRTASTIQRHTWAFGPEKVTRPSVRKLVCRQATSVETGWPMPSLRRWGYKDSETHAITKRFPWQWEWHIERKGQYPGQRDIDLPLEPVWPGFAVNTVLFSMCAAVLVQAGLMVRRTIRKRTLKCQNCGYVLFGLPLRTPCPECGRPHT